MALQLSTTDQTTQAPAGYHQVTRVSVDFVAGQTQVSIASYVSQAAATAGAQPIKRANFNFNTVPAALLTFCYNQINAQFPGAQTVSDTATVG